MQTQIHYYTDTHAKSYLTKSLLAAALIAASPLIQAKTVKVEIVTEIRDVSMMSFQVGEKSRQTILVNFDDKSHSDSFKTGVTTIGIDLPSLRDDFKVKNVEFKNDSVDFTATGTTGSFVGFFGDIDYEFSLKLDSKTKAITYSGCHNEYPSYYILVDGSRIYDRVQSGAVLTGALMGNCDIKVEKKTKN